MIELYNSYFRFLNKSQFYQQPLVVQRAHTSYHYSGIRGISHTVSVNKVDLSYPVWPCPKSYSLPTLCTHVAL